MLPKWIKVKVVLILSLVSFSLFGQNRVIRLETLLESTINNHPMNGQKNLISSKSNLNIKALEKRNLPNIDFNAQLSLQSENIDLEFPIPNFEPISLPLYRAQAYIESNYLFYDGGMSKLLIKNEKLKGKIGEQNIKSELFKLKDKVVDLYFSILLLNKQVQIIDSSLLVFDTQEKIVSTAINNGVVLKSDLDKLILEKIKLNQGKSTIINKIKTLKTLLSDFSGIDISKSDLAEVSSLIPNDRNWKNRPENILFDYKKELFTQSEDIISAKKKPKVILFAKAGIGYPNPFNFFDDNIAPYAIGGVKFIWNIWDWKKSAIEKQKLELEKSFIENQKTILDYNIQMQANKLVSEINGIESNEHFDNEIIQKQNKIIKTVKIQYLNGIAKISDYITEINVKRIAEIKRAIHTLEKEKSKYKLKVLLNN